MDFIVTGVSKSGTTWMQKLLNAHPDLKCYFQLPVAPFEPKVARKLGVKRDLAPIYYDFKSPFKNVIDNDEDYWNKLSKFNEKFIELCAQQDSFPNNWKNFLKQELKEDQQKLLGSKSFSDVDLFLKMYPDSKIIVMIRDPRDICVSKRFHLHRRGYFLNGDENNVLLYVLNRNRLIRKFLKYLKVIKRDNLSLGGFRFITSEFCKKIFLEWSSYYSFIHDLKIIYPNNIYLVKYEDLKEDFDGTVKSILSFLHVNAQDGVISNMFRKTDFSKLQKSSGFYRKGVVGDWRNSLGPSEIRLFEKICMNVYTKYYK